MIRAIEAYRMMCEALKKEFSDPLEEISEQIKRSAMNGVQAIECFIPRNLSEADVKNLIKIIRNEGYMVQRTEDRISIMW